MKKITRAFIIEVRAHMNDKCHDRAWHDFMGQPEAEAVFFAIQDLGKGAPYSYISIRANQYLRRWGV